MRQKACVLACTLLEVYPLSLSGESGYAGRTTIVYKQGPVVGTAPKISSEVDQLYEVKTKLSLLYRSFDGGLRHGCRGRQGTLIAEYRMLLDAAQGESTTPSVWIEGLPVAHERIHDVAKLTGHSDPVRLALRPLLALEAPKHRVVLPDPAHGEPQCPPEV